MAKPVDPTNDALARMVERLHRRARASRGVLSAVLTAAAIVLNEWIVTKREIEAADK